MGAWGVGAWGGGSMGGGSMGGGSMGGWGHGGEEHGGMGGWGWEDGGWGWDGSIGVGAAVGAWLVGFIGWLLCYGDLVSTGILGQKMFC